jgi:hypothetical protein
MFETILGGLFGGIFRVIPEVMKFLDAKNERKHELDMQDKAYKFEELKGSQKIDEITAHGQQEWNAAAIDALKTAIQGQDTSSGVKWIDGFSKLMRPLITFQWVIVLYPVVILAAFCLAVQSGADPLKALLDCFGPAEKALVASILNFWFLGRVFDRVK